MTGKSPDFARQMLSAAGLNCVVEGSGTVQTQSDEPGSSVQRGTIITLTCGENSFFGIFAQGFQHKALPQGSDG